MKTDGKVATAEEVLVAKGENLVANATDTVATLSPALTYYFWNTVGRGIRSLFQASQWHISYMKMEKLIMTIICLSFTDK